MKCPHCGGEVDFLAQVERNIETYGNIVNGVTACCGNIIRVRRIIYLDLEIPYNHDNLERDDWGIAKGTKRKTIIY